MKTGVALKIARREFAGGFASFWVYIACLALGAFAIAASGSVTESFKTGLAAQSRLLLGGDAAFTAAQRRAAPQERAFIEARGQVSETVTLRMMGEAGEIRKQISLRGVDGAFPLLGAAVLSGGAPDLGRALARKDGRWGIAASASLLEQFGLEVGDDLTIGRVSARIAARLDKEPDGLGAPGAFGPSALISVDALAEAGRLTQGQLFRATYLVRVNEGEDASALGADVTAEFGDSGLRYRAPADAVDGLGDLLDLLTSFLAVIGVAALVAGGVGVAQAASSFLESRTEAIAALKALGADAGGIRLIYLTQLGALALIGAGGGAVLGAFAPFVLDAIAGGRIPLPQALGFYPGPVLLAIALSLLAAGLFAAPALGRARATSPAALFRSLTDQQAARAPTLERALAAAAGVFLMVLAIAASARPVMTAALLVGAAIAYLVLRGAATAMRFAARRAAQRARGLRRLALANLGGPGSLAPTTAPALGLGLALLTLVAAVQANLLRQISETAPRNAPSMVFSQIPNQETAQFDQILAEAGVVLSDPENYRRAPVILGRVTRLKGEELVRDEIPPGERWVVDGEVTLTYLANKPPEATLTEGDWWTDDYDGPLLVSVEAAAAKGLDLTIGDTVGFQIFGRAIEARVASLRLVDWGGFGVNTAFILSPGALEAANPRHFAILKTPAEKETAIIAALGEALPDVVVFQTREALATAARMFADIGLAVNAAAGVVSLAGLLVLFGAFAAIARKRRVESALLKSFGATRGRVLGLYAGEFALAGSIAALLGVAMGLAAAYPVVVYVFEARWALPVEPIATIAAAAIAVAAIGGGLVGAALLSLRPAQILRSA